MPYTTPADAQQDIHNYLRKQHQGGELLGPLPTFVEVVVTSFSSTTEGYDATAITTHNNSLTYRIRYNAAKDEAMVDTYRLCRRETVRGCAP